MSKKDPKIYCLFTRTSVTGKIEQKIGLTGLTLSEAYEQAYAHNQAPYGTDAWSPFGWQIGILPPEEKQTVPTSQRLTTGVCLRRGTLIPFGKQCICGCRRWNRRFKKVGRKLVDVRKHRK